MSKKNLLVNEFRKLDVDIYDPENYEEDEVQVVDETVVNESEVLSLLNSKKNFDALNLILKNPPINTKKQETKDAVFQLFMRVVKSFPNPTDIDNACKKLDKSLIDTLMKYIYKGLEKEPKDATSLLNWHEKAYAIGGSGCIIRALAGGRNI